MIEAFRSAPTERKEGELFLESHGPARDVVNSSWWFLLNMKRDLVFQGNQNVFDFIWMDEEIQSNLFNPPVYGILDKCWLPEIPPIGDDVFISNWSLDYVEWLETELETRGDVCLEKFYEEVLESVEYIRKVITSLRMMGYSKLVKRVGLLTHPEEGERYGIVDKPLTDVMIDKCIIEFFKKNEPAYVVSGGAEQSAVCTFRCLRKHVKKLKRTIITENQIIRVMEQLTEQDVGLSFVQDAAGLIMGVTWSLPQWIKSIPSFVTYVGKCSDTGLQELNFLHRFMCRAGFQISPAGVLEENGSQASMKLFEKCKNQVQSGKLLQRTPHLGFLRMKRFFVRICEFEGFVYFSNLGFWDYSHDNVIMFLTEDQPSTLVFPHTFEFLSRVGSEVTSVLDNIRKELTLLIGQMNVNTPDEYPEYPWLPTCTYNQENDDGVEKHSRCWDEMQNACNKRKRDEDDHDMKNLSMMFEELLASQSRNSI